MKRQANLFLCTAVFFVAFSGYLLTLAPSIVTEGDSGEFITCAGVRGVPHEPGYGSYMLLATALAWFAPGGLEWGLNLSSAFVAALAIALLTHLLMRLAPLIAPDARKWPGASYWFPPLVFAFSYSFWEQAVITEVYAAAILLIVLTMHLSLSLYCRSRPASFLGLSLLLGFGFNIHYLVTITAGAAWLGSCWRFRKAKYILLALCLIWLGFATNIYLPLVAVKGPPINFGDPINIDRFLAVVSRASYGAMSFLRPPGKFVQQVTDYLFLLKGQFPWYLFILSGWGLLSIFRRHRIWALTNGVLYLGYSLGLICLINYGHMDSTFYQTRVFFIPGYLILCGWLCFGIGDLYGRAIALDSRRLARFLPGIAAALVLCHLGLGNSSLVDKHRNYISYDYGKNILSGLPDRAIVCTEGDNSLYPLFYFKYLQKNNPGLMILHPGMFRNSWYMDMLRQEHPQLNLSPGMSLVQAVNANAHLAPVFFASSRLSGGRALRPENLLYRSVPAGKEAAVVYDIGPSWRGLGDASVPKDWREQSIVAAYNEWFLRAGLLAETAGQRELAKQLYLEGVSISMGVINYSRIMHHRLNLRLADLYGRQGASQLAADYREVAARAKESIDPAGP
jgi:hypothetical protein